MALEDETPTFGTQPSGPPVTGTVPTSNPSPLAQYRPGQTAPVTIGQENSLMGTMTRFLQDLGTQPGHIPVSMQMRLKEQEAQIAADNNEREWGNFQRTMATFQEQTRQHNLAAMQNGMAMLPQAKAEIRAATPEDAPKLTAMWGKILGQFAPELQDHIHFYAKNMASVDSLDEAFADPITGKPLRALGVTRGYPSVAQDPAALAFADIRNKDLLSHVFAHMPAPFKTKVSKGEVGEQEFRDEFNKTLEDPSLAEKGMTPQKMQLAKTALNSPTGSLAMVGWGIQTNADKEKMMLKSVTSNPMGQYKVAELRKIDAQLAYAQQDPEAFTKEELDALNNRRDYLLKLKALPGSPGESKTSLVSQGLFRISNGLYQTKDDILEKTQEGTPERAKALAMHAQALQEAKDASPQAGLRAKMDTPVDTSGKNIFLRSDVEKWGQGKGALAPYTGAVSQGELSTSGKFLTLKDDEQKKAIQLDISQSAGKDLFAMANKAYKATTPLGIQGQILADAGFENRFTAGAAGLAYPEMKLYHDALEAWAGNNAKALGGEVGVLTNVDINRWVKTFPSASDSPAVRVAKEKLFNKMVNLVREVHSNIIAGKISPERDEDGYIKDPKIRAKVQGILGNLEQISKGSKLEAEAQANSPIVPSAPSSEKLSPAAKLAEEMRKGKK